MAQSVLWENHQRVKKAAKITGNSIAHAHVHTLMCPVGNFKLQELYSIDLDGEGKEFEALRTLPQSI